MAKKIGFTGADSTGKSTLIEAIYLRLSNIWRVQSLIVGDIARSSPYPLVDQQNIYSSNWILEQVVISEVSLQRIADIVICDRTVLDIWIFSRLAASLGSISDNQLDSFRYKIRQALRSYHVIFYSVIDNEIPVKLENVPNSKLKIREEFEEILLSSVEEFQCDTFFVKLPSAPENRMNLVLSTLKSIDVTC